MANKLIIAAVAGHMNAIHLDSSVQQHEERRTHVYDALIDDQNVHRLNKTSIRMYYRSGTNGLAAYLYARGFIFTHYVEVVLLLLRVINFAF